MWLTRLKFETDDLQRLLKTDFNIIQKINYDHILINSLQKIYKPAVGRGVDVTSQHRVGGVVVEPPCPQPPVILWLCSPLALEVL
jgi:hypothetical protein